MIRRGFKDEPFLLDLPLIGPVRNEPPLLSQRNVRCWMYKWTRRPWVPSIHRPLRILSREVANISTYHRHLECVLSLSRMPSRFFFADLCLSQVPLQSFLLRIPQISVAVTPQLSIAGPQQQTPKLEDGVHSILPTHGLTTWAEAGKRSPI